MKDKKRGISSIVATILIVMMTVLAVTILAQFVVPFVRNNLTKSSECVPYRNHFTFQESMDYNNLVYNFNCNSLNLHGFSVKAGKSDDFKGEGVSGFNVIFKNENMSVGVKVIGGSSASSAEGAVRMLYVSEPVIKIPEEGEVNTYVYNYAGGFEGIEIQPILESGRICETSDSIKVLNCDSHVSLGI